MRVGRVHQGDGVIPVDAPLDARGFFRFGHLARRFRVSGLVMWLFPCRGPTSITNRFAIVVADNGQLARLWPGRGQPWQRIGSFPYFWAGCESLKPCLAEVVVSSAPLNVEGKTLLKDASGQDDNRSAA